MQLNSLIQRNNAIRVIELNMRPLRLETLRGRIKWKGGSKPLSTKTLETMLGWMWKGKRKQVGKNRQDSAKQSSGFTQPARLDSAPVCYSLHGSSVCVVTAPRYLVLLSTGFWP